MVDALPMPRGEPIGETFDEALDRQIEALARWGDKNAPHCKREQAHAVEGTEARAYWHHGYLVALRDVKRLLADKKQPN